MIPIRGKVPTPRLAGVTLSLIVLNVLVFLLQFTLEPDALQAFVEAWGVVPARQIEALGAEPGALERWLVPIFTSMFIHIGWLHLLGNMLFLWVFGEGAENRLGHAKFLMAYLFAGVAAAQVQVLAAGDSAIPMVGASGAVAGVLGVYVLTFPRARILTLFPIFIIPVFFYLPAALYIGMWIVYQLAAGLTMTLSAAAGEAGGVAWWAHVGGFVAGMVFRVAFVRRDDAMRPRERRAAGPGPRYRPVMPGRMVDRGA